MTIITIPTDLIREKELVLLSRKQYEKLLKYPAINSLKMDNNDWQNKSKKNLLKFYSKTDAIYDRI